MSFVLNAHITIGTYSFKAVNEVRIHKGVHSYVDTAEITIPTTARLKKQDTQTVSELTAQQFNRGDKVVIKLGYNGELKTEFTGFVNRVNFSTPCKVECEGFSYLLKTKNINKSWKSISLKALCQELVLGTEIEVSDDIPSMNITSLRVPNAPSTKVLDHLKKRLKLSVYFIDGNKLYVGTEEVIKSNTVKYKIGWNVIDESGLKFKQANDRPVKVVLKSTKAAGGRVLYSTGDAHGEVREFIVKNTDQAGLEKVAEGYLKKLNYTGYEGKINAFLQPYAVHGDTAQIIDNKYPERSGSYFIDSTDVTYGISGARRNVEVSKKLSS